MSLNLRDVIEREQRTMGRPCTLVEHHRCDDGTLFVLYDVEPSKFTGSVKLPPMKQRRAVVYRDNGTPLFSGVVSTNYDDEDGRRS